MRIKVVFGSLLVLLLLSAFAPLFAVALPEGRTLDEAHDSGYIDWSGGVNYADLFHRDGICPSGCTENVTQISSGGAVSGALAGDVGYFEVMLAYSGAGGFGTATIQACSSSYSVYLGVGGATPGFNSFPLSVPSGCTSWSVSASGGVVYFRSVDANYSYIPPTSTFTPSPTPTETETPTPTPTETLTPTATETETPTPTPTSTETLTPTPSDTPIPSNTPVPSNNNDDDSDSSSSDSGWHLPVIPFAWFPSATPNPTATPLLSVQIVPTTVSKTSTPVHAPTSTSIPPLPLPTDVLACTPSAGSDFSWWILPAGMTIASALSLLSSFLKNLDTASVALGDLSFNPFGVTVPIPRRVSHKTTVGEWVMRPIRTMVSIMRTIWRTITEAVARFVNRVRQVIDKIVHSEWVTTFKQVAKTFWENVTEKVPLLGWLGKVIGFIWKTVVKPVIRWVTEAIRTLRTWVESVILWIVEKIQDGWNYITRQVSETIREWVEKTDWVRDWVTKEITVWETVWEKKFYAFPVPLGGGGGKLAAPAQQTWSSLLAKVGLTVMLGTLAVTLQKCPDSPTPPCTPTPNVAMTNAVGTEFANLMTQTAMAFTPTPMPTATATLTPAPTQSPCTTVQANEGWLTVASRLGVHIWDLDVDTNTIPQLGQMVCWKNPPPPIPAGAIVFPAANVSCLEIAAIYGVSLKELESANANRAYTDGQNNVLVINWNERDENGQPKCNIQPNANIVVPRPTLLSVPEAVQKYPCVPQQGKECLKPNASMEEVLQYVLYNEGGSTEGNQFSANVMQVMINRTNQLLIKWNMSRGSMSKDEYARWLLHVISMPADANETAPAFEAFFRASEPVNPNDPTQADKWNTAAQIAQAALDGQSPSAAPEITSDVQFYCSVKKDSVAPPIVFALQIPLPGENSSSLTNTYFFTSFPPSVSQWCQLNSPNQ